MKNALKRGRWSAFMTVLLLALLAQVFQSYSSPVQSEMECLCKDPYNLSITNRGSGAISFAWNAAGSPDSFEVWYYRREDNYTSQPVTTTNLNHTFSGLSAGTYDVQVKAVCGAQGSGGIIWVDIIL